MMERTDSGVGRWMQRPPLSRWVVVCMLVGLICAPGAYAQEECQAGGLGSTLLIPYFEFDPQDANGVTTLFAVAQEANSPRIVRVVLWTDWGIPTMAFDIYLAPFDVQTINVRNLFSGVLPSTGVGIDLSGISGCSNASLAPTYSPLSPANVQFLRDAHTGEATSPGQCKASDQGDGLVRGYVTIDTVDQCSGAEVGVPQVTPVNDSLPYFGSVATDANVLRGDWFIVDPGNNSAQGYEAVALWSDAAQFSGPDTHSFYGRYVGWDGSDHRVPLARVWGSRFADGGPFDGGTDFIVWRDTKAVPDVTEPCVSGPDWAPLEEAFISGRNEEAEQLFSHSATTFFDLATQRVNVSEFSPSEPFGRVQFGFSHSTFSNAAQSWLGWRMTALGRYSVGMQGSAVISNCGADPTP